MRFAWNNIILRSPCSRNISETFFHNISIRRNSDKLLFKNETNFRLLNKEISCSGMFCSTIQHCYSINSDDIKYPLEAFIDDKVQNFVPRSLRLASMPQQVLIVHPYIKWGPQKKRETSPFLQLKEAVSLIKTFHDWKIVSTKKIPLAKFDRRSVFDKDQLKYVQNLISKNHLISSVFINVNSMELYQLLFLENIFNVPVFDRYSIVINILKRHAVSKEARLQVSLAEIPFLKSRITGINELERANVIKNIGSHSENSILYQLLKALSIYEEELKKSIYKAKSNRMFLRERYRSMDFPVISVVGYTNTGKTSLIKCLTKEKKIKPEDQLFATVDVTDYAGTLTSGLKVLYVDTIGFISDIPTNLLPPFTEILEDAFKTDLIIHVMDISHPDYIMQKSHVLKTLESFNLKAGLMKNIISVGNKCDKVPDINNADNDLVLTSCTKKTGLSELQGKIEKGIINALQLQKIRFRVMNGGKEYLWLKRQTVFSSSFPDENNGEFVFLDVLISQENFKMFNSYFCNGFENFVV